jgi:hypothetical protein
LGTEPPETQPNWKDDKKATCDLSRTRAIGRGARLFTPTAEKRFKRLGPAIAKSKDEKTRRVGYLTKEREKEGKVSLKTKRWQEEDDFQPFRNLGDSRKLHVGQLAGGV